MLIDVDLVARTGGIRFLLHALGEGPLEMGPILAATFLYIVDSPHTRAYLNVGTDLEVRKLVDYFHKAFLTRITTSYISDSAISCYWCLWERSRPRGSNEGMCQGYSADVENLEWYVHVWLVTWLKLINDWPGLMYFCMDNMSAIRSLIDTLRIPSLETRVSLSFSLLFELCRATYWRGYGIGNHTGYVFWTVEY